LQNHKKNLLFSVSIPGRVGIKKNSRRLFKDAYGKSRSLPSTRFKTWEAIASAHVAHARTRFKGLPYKGPIFAYFEFHFLNRVALPDTSNCIEGPQDVMESLGVFENDKQIERIEARRFIGGEMKTLIRLYKIGGEQ